MSQPPARPLTASERDWLAVRAYLTEHHYDLAVAAAEDYPPARRMAGTPLLAAPGRQPPVPIPLLDIGLELDDADPKTPAEAEADPAEAGTEAAATLLPCRADGTRYRRYSEAVGELAAPLVFENRATYRLTEADLACAAPRLAFTSGRYFDGIDTGEAAAHEYAAARLGGPGPGPRPVGPRPVGPRPVGPRPVGLRPPRLGAPRLRAPRLRDRFADPCDLRRRPANLAISMLTLRLDRGTGRASFLLHWRDPARVGHAGGLYQVIPVGVFQPSGEAPSRPRATAKAARWPQRDSVRRDEWAPTPALFANAASRASRRPASLTGPLSPIALTQPGGLGPMGASGGLWCTKRSRKPKSSRLRIGAPVLSVDVVTLSGMDSELPPTLRNHARQQEGVVSRSQALRAGLSPDMIKFRVRSGWWRPVHRGVYLTFTGAPGHGAQLWAALLGAGPGAVLSHETAAELQRLADRPADSIHVTVPWRRRVKAVQGVSLHRCTRAGEIVLGYSNPPRTGVEETVLDLTNAAATFDEVCGWVTRAFARDLTDAARLRAAMGHRARLRWRTDLDELITAAAGGDHSVLEYRYGRDVERAHGLPEPARQAPFQGPDGRPGRRDRLYRDYGVVVELDGRLAHPAEARWRDRARDNVAAVDGQQTLRYGWMQVTRHACETAAQVAQVLRVRGWDGWPRPCSPGCPVVIAISAPSGRQPESSVRTQPLTRTRWSR